MLKRMVSRNVKACVLVGSATAVAFIAGKYYERNTLTVHLSPQPALPVFGSVSAAQDACSLSAKTSFLDRLLSKNVWSIEAASPLTENGNPQIVPRNSSRISQIMKYGYPSLDNVISYNDYILSYDRRNKVANWVFEHLTAESVKGNEKVDRSKCNFVEAQHVHPYFRSRNSDYKGSGYDRGHLAAAGNHKACQQHVEETFYLTNMAPQVGKGFNRDSWNRLEKYVRKLTKRYPNVYCCTGPLYLPNSLIINSIRTFLALNSINKPSRFFRKESNGKMYVKYEVIGSQHVAVPTHFYKMVVGENQDGSLEMECYVMENTI
ncbi:hypothetical protein HUJ04_011385 [Dendroctonus ponderosae]|nr:hypothetical protein HUJ04_011385 [Dendroctonus ponderosae]